MSTVRTFPDAKAVAEACAQQILEWLRKAIAGNQNGLATMAISGGSSPRVMFEIFAATEFRWDRVHLFWADERCVPADDAQSNYKFTSETWLDPGHFPAANVHRVRTELAPADAAVAYVAEIRKVLGGGQIPVFDVIHRGMGPDAHTASLFPGEPLIANHTDIAAAVWVGKFKQWRVTLLPGVLEAARHTAMLVAGADKTEAFKSVPSGPYDPLKYPAQLASRDGSNALWFVDAAAAAGV